MQTSNVTYFSTSAAYVHFVIGLISLPGTRQAFTACNFFIKARSPSRPLADCREILPHDRNLCRFFDAGPKV